MTEPCLFCIEARTEAAKEPIPRTSLSNTPRISKLYSR